MYIPAPFRVDDRAVIAAFMQRFDFAAVVTHSAAGLLASHLPVLVREAGQDLQIVGHVARANPHWKSFDGRTESMVIFQGPHGYVSPTWYSTPASAAVPTWNYTAVHAYGAPRAREDAAFIAGVVEDLTRRYEGPRESGWSPEALPPDSYRKLLAAIVGFEMTVVRCEAKFKLGQNRSAADRSGAVAGLEREQTSAASELARFMTQHGDPAKPRDPSPSSTSPTRRRDS